MARGTQLSLAVLGTGEAQAVADGWAGGGTYLGQALVPALVVQRLGCRLQISGAGWRLACHCSSMGFGQSGEVIMCSHALPPEQQGKATGWLCTVSVLSSGLAGLAECSLLASKVSSQSPQGTKGSALEPSSRRLLTTSSCRTTLAAGDSLGQGLLLQCALPRARGLLQHADCVGHADPWGQVHHDGNVRGSRGS